ncbi:MAG: carbon-nitrogen hydrolase family protein [Flaviflexus sp.]|nr:carbon-nitrogen hydrolase family protein [Flaviflexus sp.]
MIVAAAQYSPRETKEESFEVAAALVDRARRAGAELVVLPEFAFFTAMVMDDAFVESAEDLDGPSVRALQEMSTGGPTIVAGLCERATPGHIYNTLVGVQEGQVRATYRKLHLYDAFGFKESDRVIAGDPAAEIETLSVGDHVVGMQTCYDVRFPEVTRRLVDAGADIIALPAQWMPGPMKEFHWRSLTTVRAIENTVYVIASDQCSPTGAGHSAVIDPLGTSLAALGDQEGIALAEVDADHLAKVRTVNPALQLRRFEVSAKEDGRD